MTMMIDAKTDKYNDCLVLRNPGTLRLPIEKIYDGGTSMARNQRIQNMFRMIGFGENLGPGFPLILSAWNEKHWLKPELIEQRELMQVKPVLSIETKDVGKEMPGFVKDFVKDFVKELPEEITRQLNERQIEILGMIAVDSTVSAKAISEKISEKVSEKDSITERTIQNDLAKLKKLGILIRKGGRKNGEWAFVSNINDLFNFLKEYGSKHPEFKKELDSWMERECLAPDISEL